MRLMLTTDLCQKVTATLYFLKRHFLYFLCLINSINFIQNFSINSLYKNENIKIRPKKAFTCIATLLGLFTAKILFDFSVVVSFVVVSIFAVVVVFALVVVIFGIVFLDFLALI